MKRAYHMRKCLGSQRLLQSVHRGDILLNPLYHPTTISPMKSPVQRRSITQVEYSPPSSSSKLSSPIKSHRNKSLPRIVTPEISPMKTPPSTTAQRLYSPAPTIIAEPKNLVVRAHYGPDIQAILFGGNTGSHENYYERNEVTYNDIIYSLESLEQDIHNSGVERLWLVRWY